MSNLSRDQREVLVLSVYEGLSHDEIAEIIDSTPGPWRAVSIAHGRNCARPSPITFDSRSLTVHAPFPMTLLNGSRARRRRAGNR
ncbi:MAG: hypothetical protein KGR69_03770 [Verrucomicrobia bacterium]|nr:hypothetical protein [Verrucomicrobiota bacterium]